MFNLLTRKSLQSSILFILLISILFPTTFLWKVPKTYAATYEVINLDDSGAGSLRQAITDANANPGADSITFTVAGTINLLSALPDITGSLTIDATSTVQAGANIVLNATGFVSGLAFQSGTDHIVKGIGIIGPNRGIKIGSDTTGITIGSTEAEGAIEINGCSQSGIANVGGNNVTIQNSYIGLSSANGIGIESNSNGGTLTIGGSGANQRNYISGNTTQGISIADTGTVTIKGNYIGTNAAGDAALANGSNGILLGSGAEDVIIGGSGAEANTISGNASNGISTTSGSLDVEIYGNYIGTNPTGTASIGNGGAGIVIGNNSTIIGDTVDTSKANIISSNSGYGIQISSGNLNTISRNKIGTNASGGTAGVNANTLDAIAVSGTSANNSITLNTIRPNDGKSGILFNAGNGNLGRQNNFISGTTLMSRTGGNEDISTPTFNTITSSFISGSAAANGTVDIYVDGTWTTSTTADAGGNFSKSTLYSGTNAYASVTNAGNSTSSTTVATAIVSDIIAPSTPIISNTASATNLATVTLTGTKETNSSIWINGTEVIAIDALTTWSTAALALVEGSNSYSVTSKDGAGNESGAASYTITKDTALPGTPILSATTPTAESSGTITGSGTEAGATVYKDGTATSTIVDGTGGFTLSVSLIDGPNTFSIKAVDAAGNESALSSITIQKNGGGTGFMNSSFHQTHIDEENNDDENNDEEDNEETTDDIEDEDNTDNNPDESTNETYEEQTKTDNTQTDIPSGEEESLKTLDETQNKAPTTSFVKEIIKVVEHVKTETEKLRENLPEIPALEPKFKESYFTSGIFGEQNHGIPQDLIKNILGDANANLEIDSDRDGLLDGEEILYGGDPKEKDSDGDGLNDLEEVFFKGTDPSRTDSDGDGVSDKLDQNPLFYNNPSKNISSETITTSLGTMDSDKDGLCDLEELYFGTNPNSSDSDEDGFSDGDEFTFYGTDPLVGTNAKDTGSLHITNIKNKETLSEGKQFLMGNAKPNEIVKFYSINKNNEAILIGETVTDENGKYIILTENLSVGEHKILAVSSSADSTTGGISDVSRAFTIYITPHVERPIYMGFDPQGSPSTSNRTPELELKAVINQKIVIIWRSAILSQTLIADASGQIITAKPVENLELGEHTVTWYAIDLENGTKSAPTQMNFSVINTAFISGDNGDNKIIIILSAVAGLLAITTLTLLIKRRRSK
jgi:hypothetical protein